MTTGKINFTALDKHIYKHGVVVGETDKFYNPQNGHLTLPDILVKGDLSGELEYAGKKMIIEHIDTIIGMEVTPYGARGPVWKNVECKILN